MIARGNWAQFTFLHTYHHTSIFLVYWMVTSAAYDGDVYYTIVANSFIHFIMYAYYGLTTVNVPIRKFGFVVTNAQLFQFVTMMFQALMILFYPGCNQYPRNVTIFYLFYILSLFLLFSDFKGKRFGDKKALPPQSPVGGATSPTLADAAKAKQSFDASTTSVQQSATAASTKQRK
jgi:elongation of very long chain fatty acids protein 4